MAFRKVIFTWAFGFALTGVFSIEGCSSSPARSSDKPAQELSPEQEEMARDYKEELSIGKEMAARLAGHLEFDGDHPAAAKYLTKIARVLARQSSRPEIEYFVGIVKSPDVNAYAAPGGYIFVTQGLLRAVKNEQELAGVLGHEVAHVAEKHMYNQIRPKRKVSMGENVTRMLSRGGSDMGFSLSQVVNAGMKILLDSGWGAEKESEADRASTLYAASAGYAPQALYAFLVRLSKIKDPKIVDKTHPPFGKRLADLESFMKAQGLDKMPVTSNQATLNKRFRSELKDFVGAK